MNWQEDQPNKNNFVLTAKCHCASYFTTLQTIFKGFVWISRFEISSSQGYNHAIRSIRLSEPATQRRSMNQTTGIQVAEILFSFTKTMQESHSSGFSWQLWKLFSWCLSGSVEFETSSSQKCILFIYLTGSKGDNSLRAELMCTVIVTNLAVIIRMFGVWTSTFRNEIEKCWITFWGLSGSKGDNSLRAELMCTVIVTNLAVIIRMFGVWTSTFRNEIEKCCSFKCAFREESS